MFWSRFFPSRESKNWEVKKMYLSRTLPQAVRVVRDSSFRVWILRNLDFSAELMMLAAVKM